MKELSNFRVAIIEDEEVISNQLMKDLNLAGFEQIHTFSNPTEFIAKENYEYEFIFCDIIMPSMNGIEFLLKYKNQLPEETKIIMLSSEKDVTIVMEALRAGASQYINKPWSSEDLMLKISNLIER